MDKNDKVKSPAWPASPRGAQQGEQKSKIKSDDGVKQSDGKKIEEELKQKIEEFENKYKRVLADYQNLEKRVAQERKDWVLRGNKGLLLRLLPVLDTLILAENHSKDQGIILSVQQFQNVLKLEGVERIETIGKSFDPHIMECIDTGEGEGGKVIEEIRAGYMLYDKVLRVAQVKVGK